MFRAILINLKKVKVKVSLSLIDVGALGFRVPLFLCTAGECEARPSPFAAISFSYSEKVRIYSGLTESVFSSCRMAKLTN